MDRIELIERSSGGAISWVLAGLVAIVAGAGCDRPASGAPDAGLPVDGAATDPDASVDGPLDAGPDGPPPPDAPQPPPATILYLPGSRHSPISTSLVARLQAIAASSPGNERVFAKVGDSITAAPDFLRCFDSSPALGNHGDLASTIAYFAGGNAAGSTPYARASLAAVGGTMARDVLAAPSRLQAEIDAIDPRFSVVMFGTNDVRAGLSLATFGAELWAVIDASIANGVIPILSTIPSLAGDPDAPRVPSFNLVIRAIAQGRGIPLVDLYRELAPLSNRGLSSDDVHPSTAPAGACSLTDASLLYGYNVRNLITLEALARARAALGGTASDASAPTRAGAGTVADPFLGTLPLVDLGDTRNGTASISGYPCNATPQGGREVVYRVDLASTMTLEANAIDRNGVDVHVHLLAGSASPQACVASGNPTASAVVGPGPVYIVVDSPGAGADGEFVLVVERR